MLNIFEFIQLVAGRIRASILRLRGAKIAEKANISNSVNVPKAARVSAGLRFKVESDVYLKLVSDTARLSFGNFVFIGKGSEFDVKQEVSVGSNVLIAPGVFITDHNHGISPHALINEQPCVCKKVTIHDDVWIGANAVILPGVTLSEGSVVGAGAVVTKSVKAMSIVAGVPAKIIGTRN